MYKAFCYGCKEHIVTDTEENFRAEGHVNTKEAALKKYQVHTNRLRKNVQTRV